MGVVVEKNTQGSLPGAAVIVSSNGKEFGAVCNAKGEFAISSIPVGRCHIFVSMLGFVPYISNNIPVYSGKETVLEIAMEEDIVALEEVTVTPEVDKEQPLNRMAVVSARMMSSEATINNLWENVVLNDFKGNSSLLKAFAQWQYRLTNAFSMTPGIYGQVYTLNSDYAIEPRIGFKWDVSPLSSFSLGSGLFSQLQPRQVYYAFNALFGYEWRIRTKRLIFNSERIHFKLSQQNIFLCGSLCLLCGSL